MYILKNVPLQISLELNASTGRRTKVRENEKKVVLFYLLMLLKFVLLVCATYLTKHIVAILLVRSEGVRKT